MSIDDFSPSFGLLTDRYEFTMVQAALQEDTADTQVVFEVFTRTLPAGRGYGVVAGIERMLHHIQHFSFTTEDLRLLSEIVDGDTLEWLRTYSFSGTITALCEGDVYFSGTPIVQLRGGFAECVVLETLILSILNHDCAVAAAASRMRNSAGSRQLIEMGSRRTHEHAAIAAARSAYVAGFNATSNMAAGHRWGIETVGTAAHAFTLLHVAPGTGLIDEKRAFSAQIKSLGASTALVVDTLDITAGVEHALEIAGPELGAVRIDSGDLGVHAQTVRQQLDQRGAHGTKIIVSGDLDEHSIAALASRPVDAYGVGTSVVNGSGHPTAHLVFKLVEVGGQPVAKRSASKQTTGGAKTVLREFNDAGTLTGEHILTHLDVQQQQQCCQGTYEHTIHSVGSRRWQAGLKTVFEHGKTTDMVVDVRQAQQVHAHSLIQLPWEGLSLSPRSEALSAQFSNAASLEQLWESLDERG